MKTDSSRTLKEFTRSLEPITTFDPEDNSDSDEIVENFNAEANLESSSDEKAEAKLESTQEEKAENKITSCSKCELLESYKLDNSLVRQQVDLLLFFIRNNIQKSAPESFYKFLDELCEKPDDDHIEEENKITPCTDCELLGAYRIENDLLRQQVDILTSFIKNTRQNSVLDKLCKKPKDDHFSDDSSDEETPLIIA